MEIDLELAISKEEFFEFLYDSIIHDVEESTGNLVSQEDIVEGFEYDKQLKTKIGRLGEASVILSTFRPYTKYVAEFISTQGKNITSYDITSLDDEKIRVTYKEDYIAADRLKSWNFKLLSFFYKNKNIKSAESRLKNIEGYIKNKRNGGE